MVSFWDTQKVIRTLKIRLFQEETGAFFRPLFSNDSFMDAFEQNLLLAAEANLPDEGLRYIHHWLSSQSHQLTPALPVHRLWHFLREILERELELKQSEHHDLSAPLSSPHAPAHTQHAALSQHIPPSDISNQPTRSYSTLGHNPPPADRYQDRHYLQHEPAPSHQLTASYERTSTTSNRHHRTDIRQRPPQEPIQHTSSYDTNKDYISNTTVKARYISTSSSYKLPERRPVPNNPSSQEHTSHAPPSPPRRPIPTRRERPKPRPSHKPTPLRPMPIHKEGQPPPPTIAGRHRIPRRRPLQSAPEQASRPTMPPPSHSGGPYSREPRDSGAISLNDFELSSSTTRANAPTEPPRTKTSRMSVPPPERTTTPTTSKEQEAPAPKDVLTKTGPLSGEFVSSPSRSWEDLECITLPRTYENAIRDMVSLLKRSPLKTSISEESFEYYLRRRLPEYVKQEQINLAPIKRMMTRVPSADAEHIEAYFQSVVRCGLPWHPVISESSQSHESMSSIPDLRAPLKAPAAPTHGEKEDAEEMLEEFLASKRDVKTSKNPYHSLPEGSLEADIALGAEDKEYDLFYSTDSKDGYAPLTSVMNGLQEQHQKEQHEKAIDRMVDELYEFDMYQDMDVRGFTRYLQEQLPSLIKKGQFDLGPVRQYLLSLPLTDHREIDLYLGKLTRFNFPWLLKLPPRD